MAKTKTLHAVGQKIKWQNCFLVKAINITNVITIKPEIPSGIYIVVIHGLNKKKISLYFSLQN